MKYLTLIGTIGFSILMFLLFAMISKWFALALFLGAGIHWMFGEPWAKNI